MDNEITVKLNCSIDKICEILENKNFKVSNTFILDDTYYIPEELELENRNYREILKQAIILRKITEFKLEESVIKLTKKIKDIDEQGNILKQRNIDCDIIYIQEGMKFLNAIGYKEIMNIKENDIEYEKDGLKILVKDVENGDNLIEVEIQDNKELDTIDKIKQKIGELNLPIDTNDYFVKKAEIELKKVL